MGCNCGGSRPRISSISARPTSPDPISDPVLASATGAKYEVRSPRGDLIRTFETPVPAERFARARGATVVPIPA